MVTAGGRGAGGWLREREIERDRVRLRDGDTERERERGGCTGAGGGLVQAAGRGRLVTAGGARGGLREREGGGGVGERYRESE